MCNDAINCIRRQGQPTDSNLPYRSLLSFSRSTLSYTTGGIFSLVRKSTGYESTAKLLYEPLKSWTLTYPEVHFPGAPVGRIDPTNKRQRPLRQLYPYKYSNIVENISTTTRIVNTGHEQTTPNSKKEVKLDFTTII